MVSLAGAALVTVLVAGHTLVAAVVTRLLRVRFSAQWTPIVGAAVVVPTLLVASTLVVTGGLGLGPDLGGTTVVLFVFVAVPLGLGLAIDYLWMPAPTDVDLPTRDD